MVNLGGKLSGFSRTHYTVQLFCHPLILSLNNFIPSLSSITFQPHYPAYPLKDTTQPVDSEEEGLSSTMDKRWLIEKNPAFHPGLPQAQTLLVGSCEGGYTAPAANPAGL